MYVCICENLNANVPESNLKVPFHECKQSGVACSYLEMLPLENCVSPSSPSSPITNHHEFDGSKKQELVPFNLEGRGLTTRCQQEHTPSKCSRREFFSASSSFRWLQVFLHLWLYLQPPPPLRSLTRLSHLCVKPQFPSSLHLGPWGKGGVSVHFEFSFWVPLPGAHFHVWQPYLIF